MKRPNPNYSDADGSRKRNRENDETIRLLIPSKVSNSLLLLLRKFKTTKTMW